MSTGSSSPPTPSAPATSTARANRPIAEIVAYAAVAIGVLWFLGGWGLPFVIGAIILIVIVHELGHFVTARLTGMKATQFFVGFGPRLWSRMVGETEVGIKAIWLGGYVRIVGMTSAEDVGEADEPRSFRQATFPRRVLVASAGSIMHVLMALVLAWASLLAIGQVAGHFNQVDELTSWAKGTHTPAQLAGLRANDVVVSVNGHANLSEDALFALIKESPGIPLTFVVRREGPQHTLILHTLTVTPVDCHTVHECSTNSVKVPAGQPSSGVIGVAVGQLATYSSVSLPASVPDAFSLLDSTIKAIAVGTYHVFSPAGFTNIVHADVNSQVATSTNFTNNYRPISIWGIVHAALQLASKSPKDLFLFFMIVNLAFGTLNMLPMLPLDGGYVAIAIYERLRTRRGRVPYRADVNKLMPLVYAFVLILLVYVVSDLYLDIAHPLNF